MFPIARGCASADTDGGLVASHVPARTMDSEGSETWTSSTRGPEIFAGRFPPAQTRRQQLHRGPFLEPQPMTERIATALPVDKQKARR